MSNQLKTRIIIESQDEMKLYECDNIESFNELGATFNHQFGHYSITVGSILDFEEWGGPRGKHEVIQIQTLTYPKTENLTLHREYDIAVIYYVKRLF